MSRPKASATVSIALKIDTANGSVFNLGVALTAKTVFAQAAKAENMFDRAQMGHLLLPGVLGKLW